MNLPHEFKSRAVSTTLLFAGCVASLINPASVQAQSNSLTNGLVAYWPMDVVTNGVTPDLCHGYDLILNKVLPANFIPSTRNGGKIGTGSTVSAGNAVSFTNSQGGFLYYLANPGDLLPINLQPNYTINFWINILGTNQTDLRIFAEDDFNGNTDPLWVVGTGGGSGSSLDNNLHWQRRQQSITINGLAQSPDAVGTQNDSYTSLNPCDGKWHMLTITKQLATNTVSPTTGSNVENFEVYIDGIRDPGNSGETGFASHLDAFGADAVLVPEPATNQDHPPTPWTWLINATSFGGISRTITGNGFITGQMDDAAMWNRPLTTTEITGLYQNGLTNVPSFVVAGISSFAPDAHEVLYGDTVTLRWNTSRATDLTISPGIGDVSPFTVNGTGSVTVTITSNVTYTLVASRVDASVTNTVSIAVSQQPVAANWHLLENFDALPASGSPGIPAFNWENILGDLFQADFFDVSSLTNTNRAITVFNHVGGTAHQGGGSPTGAVTAYLLNGLTIQTNATNSLFFRVYIQATNVANNDFSFFLGINDLNLQPLAVALYDDFDAGPRINIQRTATGTGGVIDVSANDGVAGYEVVENGVTQVSSTKHLSTTVPAGLTPGVVYDFWIDLFDQPFGSSTNANGTTNTSGTLYSVYYKPLGAPTRAEMFTNLLSDRSPFGGTPPPLSALGQIYLELDSQTHNQNLVVTGANSIVVDDLYLSKSNLNGTIPVAPGVFPDLVVPASITLGAPVYLASDPANNNHSSTLLNWSSIPGATYTVYKSSTPVGTVPWQLVVTELPGGAVTTYYKDIADSGSAAFYKITSP